MLPSPPLTHVEVTKVLSVLIEKVQQHAQNGSDEDSCCSDSDDIRVETNAHEYVVGMTVRVDSRTWPGINKHGGVGTIKKIVKDAQGRTRLNVKYILGGMEKNLETKYVHPEDVINNKSKRAHHQRTLYDPATGLQWEPSNDLSKVANRLEYLRALEAERKRYMKEQSGGQDIVEEEIVDSSSSDEDEELNLLDFKKLKQYQPKKSANNIAIENTSGVNNNGGYSKESDPMPKHSRTSGEDLYSDQNGNAIMKMQEEDEEDDVPLHKRRDVSVAITAPKDAGIDNGAQLDTGVDETRSSTST